MGNAVVINRNIDIHSNEIRWRFSRSGGPGGQNVNKVETRATLIFDIEQSLCLSDDQKRILREKLSGLVDQEGVLQISVDEERSQLRNRHIALERFKHRLRDALKPVKKRKKTCVPRGQKEERIRNKKKHGQKKQSRKLIDPFKD